MNKFVVCVVGLMIFYSSNLYARSVYTMENTKLIKGIRYDLNNKPIKNYEKTNRNHGAAAHTGLQHRCHGAD